jgi:hypothetical protein
VHSSIRATACTISTEGLLECPRKMFSKAWGFRGSHNPPIKSKVNTKIEKRLHKVKQRLTRYECQRIRFLYRQGETPMQFRKARTRTLIQLGGLVEKSGLLEPLNIMLGDDLQKDYEHLTSAAILTGALSELR